MLPVLNRYVVTLELDGQRGLEKRQAELDKYQAMKDEATNKAVAALEAAEAEYTRLIDAETVPDIGSIICRQTNTSSAPGAAELHPAKPGGSLQQPGTRRGPSCWRWLSKLT